MLVYHRTPDAEAIFREGFRESRLPFGFDVPELAAMRGAFVSAEYPLDENEGAKGDQVIESKCRVCSSRSTSSCRRISAIGRR